MKFTKVSVIFKDRKTDSAKTMTPSGPGEWHQRRGRCVGERAVLNGVLGMPSFKRLNTA